MKEEQVLGHVIGLVDHFKDKRDNGNLSAGEASVYLKCLAILGAKDAVMSLKQMESLSNNLEVLELPFDVKEERNHLPDEYYSH